MVKLIRLKSNVDSLEFNNNIQSDLVLQPNSKIALQNVSFQKTEEKLVVNSTNKTITYDNGDGSVTVDLIEGTYDKNVFTNFLSDVGEKLNSGLNSSNESDIGLKFQAIVDDDNLLNINSEYNDQFNPTEKFTDVNIDKSDSTAIFKTTSDGSWDAYIGSDKLIAYDGIHGCGIFRCQIGALDGTGDGFFIGLSETQPSDMAGIFDPTKCVFCIQAVNSAVGYSYIMPSTSGSLNVSTLLPETFAVGDDDNDILSIEASEGKIELKIYNASNPSGILLTGTTPELYTNAKELFPIIGFNKGTNTGIKNLSYTYEDDLDESSTSNIKQFMALELSSLTPPQQDDGKKNKSFSFETLAFAQALGFQNQSRTLNMDEFHIVAVKSIRFFDDTECFLVESLNLSFNSYDGSDTQEKRRDLLAVIQNARDRDQSDVLYDSNSLIFIDLNNPYPLPLRNLQFRIINSDESTVNVQGYSNMTILIQT